MIDLKIALDYSNPDVVHRFTKNFDVTIEEAGEIFNETKKLLWLMYSVHEERKMGMKVPYISLDSSLFILDEMWHNFVLFTRDYIDYCENVFGYIIHHEPERYSNKHLYDQLSKEEKQIKLEKEWKEMCSTVLVKLGEETVSKWYVEYAEKYTPDYIKSIRKN